MYMFKTAEELKSFIEWAREQRIKSVKVGTVHVEFSELAFISEDTYKDLTNGGPSTLADTEPVDTDEENELLFASATR